MEPMNFLIDSEEFKKELTEKIRSAQNRIWIQVMTFEADETGKWLLEELRRSKARTKHLIVDGYSLANVNDTLALSIKRIGDKNLNREFKETKSILKSGHIGDVSITVTNRIGLNLLKYPFRNHKKIVVIDDYAYLGGVNFSDHNFSWHDAMLRLNGDTTDALVEDMQETISKRNQSKKLNLTSQLYFLNGIHSKDMYVDLFSHMCLARKSIRIISPYVSNPLLNVLNELSGCVSRSDEVQIK